MKIITRNNKTYLKLSHSEWEFIGKAFYRKNISRSIHIFAARGKDETYNFIPLEKLANRLRILGFKVTHTSSDHSFKASFGREKLPPISINAAKKNYDTTGWRLVLQDIRRQEPDLLTFLFKDDFKIPDNFNLKTMKFNPQEEKPKYETTTIPMSNLPADFLREENRYEILVGGQWQKASPEVDWTNSALMTNDGDIIILPSISSNVTIRKEIS